MTLNEFIKLDFKNPGDRETIFGEYSNYLKEILTNDFPTSEVQILKSISGIFLQAIAEKKYLLSDDKDAFNKILDKFVGDVRKRDFIKRKSFIFRLIFSSKYNFQSTQHDLSDSFDSLFTKTLNLISQVREDNYYFDQLGLDEFYTPEKANKSKVSELIIEAIDLISTDSSLTEKSKKRIIEYLKKALSELTKKYPDWPRFLGILKETVIVLAAVSTISGNVSVLIPKQKIEEAAAVIQQTSITYNFKSITETINIQNAPKLQNFNNILQLEERNEKNSDKDADINDLE